MNQPSRVLAPASDALVQVEASAAIREVIDELGRTEDLRLSPDNRRLVVLDFLTHRIFLFTIAIETLPTPRVRLCDACIIESRALNSPHGVTFLDDDHIGVGSRGGDVCFFRLPPIGECPARVRLEPLATINGHGVLRAAVKSPGSLDAYPIGPGRFRVLVCNNFWHFVSSHTITLAGDGKARVRNEGKLFERDILLPDGISISPDRRWAAISNHVEGQVLVYSLGPDAGPRSEPVAVLEGIVCPHGLRFDGNDRLIVADAASQFLLLYEARDGWRSAARPDRYLRVMDDQTFYDGRYDSREGGIKGLDLDASGRLMLTTHRLGVVEFYDLAKLRSRDDVPDEAEIADLCASRDASIRRQKGRVVGRRWTAAARLTYVFRDYKNRLRLYLNKRSLDRTIRDLDRRARSSQESLVGEGPVVSLTSFGPRMHIVHRAIESIGRGTLKPRRLILWVDDAALVDDPPENLARARTRGLEIRLADDCGPHKKYFPYVMQERLDEPLVTADDDAVYSTDWLARLVAAYEARPHLINCHRARRIEIQRGQFTPYNEWSLTRGTEPSHLNFFTGVSGVIYPPTFLEELRRRGDAFRACSPWADDVWLNAVALMTGFQVAQVADRPLELPHVPGSQIVRLLNRNVLEGGNQVQLRRTYTPEAIAALSALANGR